MPESLRMWLSRPSTEAGKVLFLVTQGKVTISKYVWLTTRLAGEATSTIFETSLSEYAQEEVWMLKSEQRGEKWKRRSG